MEILSKHNAIGKRAFPLRSLVGKIMNSQPPGFLSNPSLPHNPNILKLNQNPLLSPLLRSLPQTQQPSLFSPFSVSRYASDNLFNRSSVVICPKLPLLASGKPPQTTTLSSNPAWWKIL